MQSYISKLIEWEQMNNMCFNLDKFKWLQIGKNEELKNSYNFFTGDFGDVITPSI